MDETTALDIATAIVAGYAAIVATVGIAVQGLTWWKAWATTVKISARSASLTDLGGRSTDDVLLFDIVNHSSHEVSIVGLGLWRARRLRRWSNPPGWVFPHPRGVERLPIEIRGRHSATPYLTYDDVRPASGMRVRAYVRTSDGKSFTSKPFVIPTAAKPEAGHARE